MASKLGCFRPALFGCLGVLIILVVGLAIAAAFAWRGVDRENVADRELVAATELTATTEATTAEPTFTPPPGRLILDLAQGEFHLRPGLAGEGIRVRGRFNEEAYALTDELEILPDSTWVYRVTYRRTIPGLQAILQSMFGGNKDSRVDIFLPPDVPIALELHIEQGGSEVDLSGLWLTDALVDASKGGFSLRIDEPLVEPLDNLEITGSMGGLDVHGLGNASPHNLVVHWRMGGANVDMGGRWLRDSRVDLSVDMGGMSVVVPRDVQLEIVAIDEPLLQPSYEESSAPVLYLHKTFKRGEIEVLRR